MRHRKSGVLNGWKEIANYLGFGIRTVQRYERKFGLPVRHVAAKGRGAALAFPEELDAWVKQFLVQRPKMVSRRDVHELPTQILTEHQRSLQSLRGSVKALMTQIAEGHRIQRELMGMYQKMKSMEFPEIERSSRI
jgi:hypothetical protein